MCILPLLIILAKRNREERISCFPALSGGLEISAAPISPRYLPCGVLNFTYCLCHLSPPLPYPPVLISVPGSPAPLRPAEAPSCPASAATLLLLTRVLSQVIPLMAHGCFFTVRCREAPFFFFKPLRIKFESESFFFLFCSFFFM